MIITIDGPAGTGKSTVAKLVAKDLGFLYVDTGALFRSLAYGIRLLRIDYEHDATLADFLENHPLSINSNGSQFFLGDIDTTPFIRDPEVSQFASKIAVMKRVRETIKTAERAIAANQDCVFEGRDMGTAVFPYAECKVFLTASAEIRAKRRYDELIAKGIAADLPHVLAEIVERDERDSTRLIDPLKAADDAKIIDTSHLTIPQVIEAICTFAKRT